MATEEGYNGWSNKPTWLVKLWIDNEQGSQEYWLSTARLLVNNPSRLADGLKEEFEDAIDDFMVPSGSPLDQAYKEQHLLSDASFYSDLVGWALAQINWREVAESLIEDAKEVPA